MTNIFSRNKKLSGLFENPIYIKRRIEFDNLNTDDFLDFKYYKSQFFNEFIKSGKTLKKELFFEINLLNDLGVKNYRNLKLSFITSKEFRKISTTVPFYEILLPVVFVAHSQITSKLKFEMPMATDVFTKFKSLFLNRLFKDLSNINSQILLKEFNSHRSQGLFLLSLLGKKKDTSQKEYRRFLEWYLTGGYIDIFKKYPLLSSQHNSALNNWQNNVFLLLTRYAKDCSIIEHFLDSNENAIKTIEFSISDYHNNGLSVSIFHFENGKSIVYKPKNIGIEFNYNKFLGWLNKTYESKLATYQVIDKDNYGWTEFISFSECNNISEVKTYFKNAGVLLCILYYLKATDCHFENIIPSKSTISFVDSETIIHPKSKIFSDNLEEIEYNNLVLKMLSESVFATGLLPNWKFNRENNIVYDISGLGITANQENPGFSLKWKFINTDGMVLEMSKDNIRDKNHIIRFKRNPIAAADYVSEIITGFRDAYHLILQNQPEINNKAKEYFSNKKIRFLFRSTSLYYSILRNLYNPKIASSKTLIALELEKLAIVLLKSERKTNYWNIYKSEVNQLLTLNVPIFYSFTDKNIVFNEQINIPDILENVSLGNITNSKFSIPDLDQQVQIISASFQSANSKILDNQKLSYVDNQLKTSATTADSIDVIAKSIVESAINETGALRWMGLGNLDQTEALQIQTVSYGIYQGSLGIAIFLSEYSEYSGEEVYNKYAYQSILPLLRLLKNLTPELWPLLTQKYGLGLGSGLGGFIYGLVRLSKKLSNHNLVDYCLMLIKNVPLDYIEKDFKNDILTGSSGFLVALLQLYDLTKDSQILDMAVFCGDSLLSKRIGNSWITINDKVPINGFAHGSTGISLSLFRLYLTSGLARFRNACFRTIEWENKAFSLNDKSWKDLRPGVSDEYKAAWCHGAVGIGLSRIFINKYCPSDSLADDILFSVNKTFMYSENSVDHICCGNFGRLDLLHEYGKHIKDMSLFETKFKQISERALKTNFLLTHKQTVNFTNPVLFKGFSGIGFQLIKFLSKKQIDSILLFE